MNQEIYSLIRQFGVTRLAQEINASPALVCKWRHSRITAERAIQVERVTGIPRHKLRPDLWTPETDQGRAA